MPETKPTENDTQIPVVDETVTIVMYEETVTTYQVPAQHLRDLGLPATSEELSDIDEDRIMEAVEGIEPFDYAVRERQISFPTDA